MTLSAPEWDTRAHGQGQLGNHEGGGIRRDLAAFRGATRTQEMPECLSALSEMMPAEAASIVFDLRELVGHNPETKAPIKAWLGKNKTKIKQITVLVPRSSTIHKVATAVISLAAGVKIASETTGAKTRR